MKKLICATIVIVMLFSVAIAEGVHIADFAERYYLRLKILQDYNDASFELKGNSHANEIARDMDVNYYVIDELYYSTDEKGIITNLSFGVDISPYKQFCAIAGLWNDTVNDTLSISIGIYNDEFFTTYINNRIDKITGATSEHAYPIGDYVVYGDNMNLRFYLKSQYPSDWIQK